MTLEALLQMFLDKLEMQSASAEFFFLCSGMIFFKTRDTQFPKMKYIKMYHLINKGIVNKKTFFKHLF
jgi:hypothetical protein